MLARRPVLLGPPTRRSFGEFVRLGARFALVRLFGAVVFLAVERLRLVAFTPLFFFAAGRLAGLFFAVVRLRAVVLLGVRFALLLRALVRLRPVALLALFFLTPVRLRVALRLAAADLTVFFAVLLRAFGAAVFFTLVRFFGALFLAFGVVVFFAVERFTVRLRPVDDFLTVVFGLFFALFLALERFVDLALAPVDFLRAVGLAVFFGALFFEALFFGEALRPAARDVFFGLRVEAL